MQGVRAAVQKGQQHQDREGGGCGDRKERSVKSVPCVKMHT